MDYSVAELEQILGDMSAREIKYLKIDNVKNDIKKSIRKQIEGLGYAYYSYYDEFMDYVEKIILQDIDREYTYWSLFKHQFRDLIQIKYLSRDTFQSNYDISTERIENEDTYSVKSTSFSAVANDICFLKESKLTLELLTNCLDIRFLDKSNKYNSSDEKHKYFLERYFNPIKEYKNPALLLYKKYSYTGGLGGYNCHYLDYEILIVS